jgi:hypothetical protein
LRLLQESDTKPIPRDHSGVMAPSAASSSVSWIWLVNIG